MTTSLDHLKQSGTIIMSDSGDFESIDGYKPQDVTMNLSLLLVAANKPTYAHLINEAIQHLVGFGKEILKIIPSCVSTEVNARLSFNKEGTKAKAKELIALYKSIGVKKECVLIKLASTWEGIRAACKLKWDHGIHCNLTLLFAFTQAVSCTEAGVTLILPFVGHILDWYKKNLPGKLYKGDEDPGLQSVKKTLTITSSMDIRRGFLP
ncbi:hypothetical protein JB92DRAFT_3132044 [Gautieria morchelliformis]|nr:hypothetical protein JB92DRAFT_3132044 [Gautieria morchelliformis]